jgi:hypothetical protein
MLKNAASEARPIFPRGFAARLSKNIKFILAPKCF